MVEIIPKQSQKTSREMTSLFYLAVLLLFFSIIGYFVLNSSLRSAKEQLAALESDLAQVMSAEQVALEKEVLVAQDQINSFALLIKEHVISSRVFEPVQNTTHPQVWFKTFGFDSKQGELRVSGETQNFVTLWQQVLILREEPALRAVDLGNFSINEKGRVNFDLLFNFYPEIFKN